ncbi:MAG: hypothetical protein K1060chlam5_00188 [Candidatus Anoxychlamydiales bacterium]|nr:hypothetical protein [Candidatus Anoxychlamydiales bacterium]
MNSIASIKDLSRGFVSAEAITHSFVHGKEINKGQAQFLTQLFFDAGNVFQACDFVNNLSSKAKYNFKATNFHIISLELILAGIYYLHVNKEKYNFPLKFKKFNRFLQSNIGTVTNITIIASSILLIPYSAKKYGYSLACSTLLLLNDYFNILPIPYVGKILKSAEFSTIVHLLISTTTFGIGINLLILASVLINDVSILKEKVTDFVRSYKSKKINFSQIYQVVKQNKFDNNFFLTKNDLNILNKHYKKADPQLIKTYFKRLKFTDNELKSILKKLDQFDHLLDFCKRDIKLKDNQKKEILEALQQRLEIIINSAKNNSISKDLLSFISMFLKDNNIDEKTKKEAIIEMCIEGHKCEVAKLDAIKKSFYKLASYDKKSSRLEFQVLSSIRTLQESIISSFIYTPLKKDVMGAIDNPWYASNDRHNISVIKAVYFPQMSDLDEDEAFNKMDNFLFYFIGKIFGSSKIPKYTTATVIQFLENEIKEGSISNDVFWQWVYDWKQRNILSTDEKANDDFDEKIESPEYGRRFALTLLLEEMKIIKNY